MNCAVIYTSQTGFTKRYAEWIGEALKADVIDLSRVKKHDLKGYDAMIFGSKICADAITKAGKFKKIIGKYPDKKYAIFSTGASPALSSRTADFFAANFSAYPAVRHFYFPAGFNYEKLTGLSRMMINLLRKMLASKKDKTEEEQAMEKMISSSYDISDKTLIVPLTEYIEGEE